MKRITIAILALLLIVAAMPALAGQTRAVRTPAAQAQAQALGQLTKLYSQDELQKGVFIGSNFCLACHTTFTSYKDTNHASFLRRPIESLSLIPGRGVIADYDHNGVDDFRQGLDFNAISSKFDKYKPNAPKLSVESGTYFITIGSLKMPLAFTLAGQRNGSAQRFVVKVPVTDTANKLTVGNYFAPLQYVPATGWDVYSGGAWYDASNAPKFAAGIGSAALVASGGPSSHSSGCIGCHSNGLQAMTKTASGETLPKLYTAILYTGDDPTVIDYEGDGEMELMNIGCENCHGPGSNHVLGGGDPTKIVNPKSLKPAQQAELCGQCHINSNSVPAGTYAWPYNDATDTKWNAFDAKAGTPLATFYKLGGSKWPDGIHYNGGRPYNAYLTSAHANFAPHTVACSDCHDPHAEGEGMLIREVMVEDGYNIPTSAEDNSLCLSCHAKYGPFADLTKGDIFDMKSGKTDALAKVANVVEKHTHHPYAPDRVMGLSRCTDCHMSAGQHSFNAISPEETLKYQDKGGMPNSCAMGCHNNRVDVFNIGVKDPDKSVAANSKWNNAIDVNLSNLLKAYYGEGGKWWDTKK